MVLFSRFMIFFAIFYSTLIVSNDSRFTLYNYIVLIFYLTPAFGPFYKKYLTANYNFWFVFRPTASSCVTMVFMYTNSLPTAERF